MTIATHSARRQIPVTVTSYNSHSGFARVVDATTRNHYELFVPAYFGGVYAPYPKVGQSLLIIYDRLAKSVVEATHL